MDTPTDPENRLPVPALPTPEAVRDRELVQERQRELTREAERAPWGDAPATVPVPELDALTELPLAAPVTPVVPARYLGLGADADETETVVVAPEAVTPEPAPVQRRRAAPKVPRTVVAKKAAGKPAAKRGPGRGKNGAQGPSKRA